MPPPTMDPAKDSPASDVQATSEVPFYYDIKLPPFWAKDAELWFAQVEARFRCSRVTSDESKFRHVVEELYQSEVAVEVRDILLNPPANDKYNTLKSAIIKRLTDSKNKMMHQLLLKEDLGDRTPSQFLCHLRALGGTSVSDALLRAIWMSRLPEHVQSAIEGPELASLAIEHLATIADKVAEMSKPRDLTINVATSMVSALESLVSQVEQLTKRVQQLETKLRGRSSSRNLGRSPFRIAPQRQDGHCYFHRKFGDKARQCKDPCTFIKQGNKQP